jgi:hypothetical protein
MPIRDEDGHRAMQAAGKAWKAIKTSGAKTWREWTEVIGPGLVNARAEAQSISNASSGKGYNAAMGALLEEYGFGNALERHRSQVSVISRADPGEPIAGPVARERGRRVAVGVGAYDAPPCVFRGWSYQGLRTSLPGRGENCGVSGSPPGNAHELGATVVATTACAL